MATRGRSPSPTCERQRYRSDDDRAASEVRREGREEATERQEIWRAPCGSTQRIRRSQRRAHQRQQVARRAIQIHSQRLGSIFPAHHPMQTRAQILDPHTPRLCRCLRGDHRPRQLRPIRSNRQLSSKSPNKNTERHATRIARIAPACTVTTVRPSANIASTAILTPAVACVWAVRGQALPEFRNLAYLHGGQRQLQMEHLCRQHVG